LPEGSYFTACKPGMTGSPSQLAPFRVTAGTATPGRASDTAQAAQAATEYLAYVKDQTAQLVTATAAFAAAYTSGDDAAARAQYPAARGHYERIEPTAEQFGDIDPALDLREADVETGQLWTGWHRIEKDLWPPAGYAALDPAGRAQLAQQLTANTQRLHDLVDDRTFSLTIDQISNGAIGLMEEVARTKITGEEERFSHTDLWDFQANVEGAEAAYATVRDIANGKGAAAKQVVRTLDSEFSRIQTLLAKYRSGTGFVPYTALTTAQVKELSDAVNALSEPLSRLTSIVVG
jgi:iron uptake system component EfeO